MAFLLPNSSNHFSLPSVKARVLLEVSKILFSSALSWLHHPTSSLPISLSNSSSSLLLDAFLIAQPCSPLRDFSPAASSPFLLRSLVPGQVENIGYFITSIYGAIRRMGRWFSKAQTRRWHAGYRYRQQNHTTPWVICSGSCWELMVINHFFRSWG